MHPFDSLLRGWEVVDTIGLFECELGSVGGCSWLPLSSVLDKWYAIAPLFVTYPNEERRAFAPYEDICFVVDCHTRFGENGYGAVIGGFAHTHE